MREECSYLSWGRENIHFSMELTADHILEKDSCHLERRTTFIIMERKAILSHQKERRLHDVHCTDMCSDCFLSSGEGRLLSILSFNIPSFIVDTIYLL